MGHDMQCLSYLPETGRDDAGLPKIIPAPLWGGQRHIKR